MCWQYENLYEECFDNVFNNHIGNGSDFISLLKNYGVKIENEEELKTLFFDMLTKAHEKEWIKPKNIFAS